MFSILRLWMGALIRLFRSRQSLLIENLALRQQLSVFKRQRRRPRLTGTDKLFWVLLHRFCSSWQRMLIVVSPDTVVRWHRAGFKMYWRLISRVSKQVSWPHLRRRDSLSCIQRQADSASVARLL